MTSSGAALPPNGISLLFGVSPRILLLLALLYMHVYITFIHLDYCIIHPIASLHLNLRLHRISCPQPSISPRWTTSYSQ